MNIRSIGAVLLAVLIGVTGCDRQEKPAEKGKSSEKQEGAVGGAGAPVLTASISKAGTISGIITDSRGKPIKGGRATVTLAGKTLAGGERAGYTVTADENGAYSADVPDGIYRIWAELRVEFNGRTFKLPLHPADGKDSDAPHNSKPGVVKNFVWKLTGPVPGKEPGSYWSNYGQSVFVFDAETSLANPEKKLAKKYPGATVVVKMIPKGSLADGSQGQALMFKMPVEATQFGTDQARLWDIPLADYMVFAVLTTKDGKEKPLQISTAARAWVQREQTAFGNETLVDFAWSENSANPQVEVRIKE